MVHGADVDQLDVSAVCPQGRLAALGVLPFAYPPLRRGIGESPLLKAGANALLGAPGSATDQ